MTPQELVPLIAWLTPPDWLGDPMSVGGRGFIQWLMDKFGSGAMSQ